MYISAVSGAQCSHLFTACSVTTALKEHLESKSKGYWRRDITCVALKLLLSNITLSSIINLKTFSQNKFLGLLDIKCPEGPINWQCLVEDTCRKLL